MSLNGLYHGALKVAELTKFPVDRVCLVTAIVDESEIEAPGVEFVGANLFVFRIPLSPSQYGWMVKWDHEGQNGSELVDKMIEGYFNQLNLALTCAGLVIQYCDLINPVMVAVLANQHD